MKFKDATRSIGSVGSLLSVLLIFLVSAGAAYACPEHGSRVAYRTRTVRTSPVMRTTLITYGGRGDYAPCGENAYSPRKVKYVAVRDNGYYNSVPRYVAVQNVRVRNISGYYPMSQTRYIAVRNDDLGYAPRYMAVRRHPAYDDMGIRYVAVRNNYVPRTRYVAVRDYDMDDYDYAPRYVAVRRYPVYDRDTRVVAVRDMDGDYDVRPVRYVAVRNSNSCACPVAVQNGFDDFDTSSNARHIVVKSDFIDGTEEVIYKSPDFDDTEYAAVPDERFDTTRVRYFDDDDSDRNYVPANYTGTRTVSYVPAQYDDSEIDDQAILGTSGATYVVADDIEDACLSPVAYRVSPRVTRTRAVSYVPVNDVDEYASLSGSEPAYIETDNDAADVRDVSGVDDDNDVVDADTAYVVTEPNHFDGASTLVVGDTSSELIGAASYTLTLAGANGYRDGFEEGKEDADDGNAFTPENSGHFRDATRGYKHDFGDRLAYQAAYRDSYLKGYKAGFGLAAGL